MNKLKTLFMLAAAALLSLITACGVFAEVDATTPSQFLVKLKAAESYTATIIMGSGEDSMTQATQVEGGKYHISMIVGENEQSYYLEKTSDKYYYYDLDDDDKWEKEEIDSDDNTLKSIMLTVSSDSPLWESVFDNDKYTYNATDRKYTLKEGEVITVEENSSFTEATLSFTKSKLTLNLVIDESDGVPVKIEFTKLNATTVTLPTVGSSADNTGGGIGNISQMSPSQFLQALRAMNSYFISIAAQGDDMLMSATAKFSDGNYHISSSYGEMFEEEYFLERKEGDIYYYYALDNQEEWTKIEIDLSDPVISGNVLLLISNSNSVLWTNVLVDGKYNYSQAENKYTLKDGQQIVFEVYGRELVFTNAVLTFATAQVTVELTYESGEDTISEMTIVFTDLNNTTVTIPVID